MPANQVWAMSRQCKCFALTLPTFRWRAASVVSPWCSIGQTPGFVLAVVDHDGSCLLRRNAGGCPGPSRRAGNLNTDQGSQFTGAALTGLLASNGIAIGMDGEGAWRDNVFFERLWRSVKYEDVYLRAYETVGEARASIEAENLFRQPVPVFLRPACRRCLRPKCMVKHRHNTISERSSHSPIANVTKRCGQKHRLQKRRLAKSLIKRLFLPSRHKLQYERKRQFSRMPDSLQ